MGYHLFLILYKPSNPLFLDFLGKSSLDKPDHNSRFPEGMRTVAYGPFCIRGGGGGGTQLPDKIRTGAGADLGKGGFDPTTMRSIVHEPRSGEPIFFAILNPRKWCFPGIY